MLNLKSRVDGLVGKKKQSIRQTYVNFLYVMLRKFNIGYTELMDMELWLAFDLHKLLLREYKEKVKQAKRK